MINLLIAAALGVVQGITEFLPVSSTAHLIALQQIFGLDQQVFGLTFDMFINFGTTAAVVWYFRKDLWELARSIRFPKAGVTMSEQSRIAWWVVCVTLVVGVTGLAFENTIASPIFRNLEVISSALIIVSILFLVVERIHEQRGVHHPLTLPRALSTGFSQVLAFIPGVSRSGITIVTGMLSGLSRNEAARYSFILSVPVTLAASLFRTRKLPAVFTSGSPEIIAMYLVGLVTAAIVGYYTIRFLLGFLAKQPLHIFAWYRFGLAAVLLIIAFT
jgi:undecaprenyl-diphosphatase